MVYNLPDDISCPPLPEDGDFFHLLHNNTDPRPTNHDDFLLTIQQCLARLDFYLFVFLMVAQKTRIFRREEFHFSDSFVACRDEARFNLCKI